MACPRSLSLFSNLSIRDAAPRSGRIGQSRSQTTARRTTKRLRPSPASQAPSPHPSAVTHQKPLGSGSPVGTRITFDPPSSAPTPYHTPAIFLPSGDPRRRLLAPSSPRAPPTSPSSGAVGAGPSSSSPLARASNPYAADAARPLPPAVRQPYEKRYNVTAEQVEEMRRLRAADPKTWTRSRLARRFGCSELFAGMSAPSAEGRRAHLDWLEASKLHFGEKRRKAREDRKKRQELIARDA